MSSSKKSRRQREHEWTGFERHTLLCLMAKNMHTAGADPKDDEVHDGSTIRKSHTYMDVTTAFNFAMHGKRYDEDISFDTVSEMIEHLLAEKKGVLGPGGSMERLGGGRITRTRKLAWERTDKRQFLGTVEEWDAGRRYAVMNEYRKERGLPLLPEEEKKVEPVPAPKIRATPRRRPAPPGGRVASAPDGAQDVAGGQLASFKRLPAALQADPRFQWANPGNPKMAPSFREVVLPNEFTQRNHRYKSERVGRVRRTPTKRKHVSAVELSAERVSETPSDEEEGAMQVDSEGLVPRTAARERLMEENASAFGMNAELLAEQGKGGKRSFGWEKAFGAELTNRMNTSNADLEGGEIA